MTSSLFRSPSAEADIPASCIVSDSAGASCSSPEKQRVGQDRLSRAELRALSDAALDGHILDCIERQNQAQIRWLANGSLADAGERDGWMLAEHEARDHRMVRRELAAKGKA